jgi:tetratricopeptide (TPR) repeat protein
MVTRRWDEAEALFERSIALDPDQVLAYVRLAEVHWFRNGDLARSRKALESSPRSASVEMVEFFVFQATYERDFERALETLVTGREIWSSHHPISLVAARLLTELGRSAEARQSFEEASQWLTEIQQDEPPDIWWAHCHLGQALAGLGRDEEALQQAAQASALFPIAKDALEGPHLAYRLLVIFVLTGEHDAAIDQLEILLSIDGFWVPTVALLEIDPTFDPLRDNPRFQALLEKFG